MSHSNVYKYYALGIVTCMLVLVGVENYVLGLMLQNIKAEFQLTDAQLGFLGGIAFALFYCVLGIPIARWADRGNRVTIATAVILLWSATVALCGAVSSFIQLLLVRIGVAAAEAGCLPLSYSLIADYFDRAERPRAVAIYSGAGTAISAIVGYFVGGWLIELDGWRKTYWLLAAPGVVLAALARFTLKEPRAAQSINRPVVAGSTPDASIALPGLIEVANRLRKNRAFRHLVMCLSAVLFFNSIGQWNAVYFIRTFGLTTGQVGSWFALVYGISGLIGSYLGGELSSRYAAQNERLQLRGMAVVILISGAFAAATYFAPTTHLAFALYGLSMTAVCATSSPLIATMQSLVPENMCAVAFALAYLVANLIGLGFGPLTAGAFSDAFQPWAGEHSLRYALVALSPGYVWAAWHALRASRTVAKDVVLKDTIKMEVSEAN